MLRRQIRIKYGPINLLAMDIVDLLIQDMSILVKRKPEYLVLADSDTPFILKINVYDKIIFNKIKFNYISFIKGDPDPDSRVAGFEWKDKDGILDFEALDRLIEFRKSRKEKKEDLDLEIFIYKETKKMGLEYYGPLRGVI